MAMWFIRPSIEDMTKRGENTMFSSLGIEITEVGDDFLKGTMPVDNRTKQPLGLLHGGANCVLAESIGSMAANYCVDPSKYFAVSSCAITSFSISGIPSPSTLMTFE